MNKPVIKERQNVKVKTLAAHFDPTLFFTKRAISQSFKFRQSKKEFRGCLKALLCHECKGPILSAMGYVVYISIIATQMAKEAQR